MMIYEIIGYTASIITALSLMMSSIIKLRWINFVGSSVFSLYGFLIHSYPVALLNGFLAITNLLHLYRIYSTKEYFRILIPDYRSKYLQYLLDFYREEIARYMPDFDFTVGMEDHVCYILRDMVPAGVLIGRQTENEFHVRLDYVLPSYRDFKIGRYLFGEKRAHFMDQGAKFVITSGGCKSHADYLKKMGFREETAGSDRYVLNLV